MTTSDTRPLTDTSAARRRRPGLRRLAAVGATSCALLALAGCGGSADTASSDAAPAGAGSGDAATADAYRECLAKHGLELPAMGEGGAPPGAPPADGAEPGAAPQAPPDGDAFAAAQEACADLAPEGGMGGPGGGGQGGMGQGGMDTEALQAYTECLTENGVELVQPDAATGDGSGAAGQPPSGGPGGIAELDESDPGVAACAELRPDLPERPPTDGATAPADEDAATGASAEAS
jgi:hypothetical protein